jgi:hypothetical protein
MHYIVVHQAAAVHQIILSHPNFGSLISFVIPRLVRQGQIFANDLGSRGLSNVFNPLSPLPAARAAE